MGLEESCRELRKMIKTEQDYWTKQKIESICNGQDLLATDAHARVAAFCVVLSLMDKLGIAVEK